MYVQNLCQMYWTNTNAPAPTHILHTHKHIHITNWSFYLIHPSHHWHLAEPEVSQSDGGRPTPTDLQLQRCLQCLLQCAGYQNVLPVRGMCMVYVMQLCNDTNIAHKLISEWFSPSLSWRPHPHPWQPKPFPYSAHLTHWVVLVTRNQ